jgi:hypothetical protein
MSGLVLLGAVISILAFGAFVYLVFPMLRTYFRFRGKRLITCPETHKTEAVDVAARRAAVGLLVGDPILHLDRCSRWPERQDCGQECLQQVEADPDNCLVWNIVSHWYEGKSCVYCHKPLGRLRHLSHPPALVGPDHKTAEWKQLRPEQLPEVFATYSPVCWDCHVAETFRRVHPELVVDRHRDVHRPV